MLGEPKDSLKVMKWGGGLALQAKEYKLSYENGQNWRAFECHIYLHY